MKLMVMQFSIALAVTVLATSPARSEGDPAAGKRVFNKCMACHDATAERNKIGPHLVGIIGRTAGSLESFEAKYSANMKETGAGGLVWDEETLEPYLRSPKDVIPQGKMAFPGLKSDDEIANVIAYLSADPKP
jgi:cytochrome c